MAARSDARERAWWRRVTLRDVVLFTLPPLALGLWLFGAAVMDYHRVRQYDDWWSAATSVRKFGWLRVRTGLRALRMTEVEKQLSAEREDLPQLRLLVEREDWDRIDDDVGGHWGEWIDAQVLDGGDFFDGELRFRGDGSVHWTTDKKSFTFKTRGNDLLKGHDSLAFSVKDVLPQWLVATLAAEFELLAPEQELVPVFLNDRFYGIHRAIEPIDEDFLRRHGQVPGNVFRADTAERGDYFKGVPRPVFMNPHIWDRVAENDRPGAPGKEVLERFLADLNGSAFEDHERFLAWLDRGELARLLAYLLVVGDPFHMSGVHNQFWYQDPVRGTFHPIPWDVRLLDLEAPPRDSNYNRFWRAALADPRLWDEALGQVAARALDGGLLERAERRVNEAWERYRQAFEYDALRSGVVPPVGDPATTLALLRKNLDTLRAWIADCRVRAVVERQDQGGLVIDVQVGGRAAADVRLAAGGERPPHLIADTNRSGVADAGDRDLGATWELGRLLPGLGGSGAELVPEPSHYRFFATAEAGAALPAVEARNALTGADVAVEALARGAVLAATTSWHPWRYERAAGEELRWSGAVRLTEDLVLDERSSLVIEAGAVVALDPGVSCLLRGRVTAQGSEEQPITIRGAQDGRPFGTFALQGPGAGGSRLSHVRFLGGGGARLGAVDYSGMVCVHGADGVVLEHCRFAANLGCDDALHVASSEVTVSACELDALNADGIDFDRSSGTIAGNRIRGAPADAIELSQSSPRVFGNELVDSVRSGLIVAEGSTPLVAGNRIAGGQVGIDVRDAAEPVLLYNRILGCGLGVQARLRNDAYARAGWPKMAGNRFQGNGTDWIAENGARRTLVGPLLASSEGELDAGELEWLLRWQGLRLGGQGPEGLELVAGLEPLYAEGFAESFADVSAGWRSDGSASRLLQRGSDLELILRREPARIARRCDWDLRDPSRVYVLVLELAGENVGEVRAAVTSPGGMVERSIELGDDPDTFGYAVIELSPGSYDGLLLSAEPISARSLLWLHGYRIFAWPAPSPGS